MQCWRKCEKAHPDSGQTNGVGDQPEQGQTRRGRKSPGKDKRGSVPMVGMSADHGLRVASANHNGCWVPVEPGIVSIATFVRKDPRSSVAESVIRTSHF